MHTGGDRVVYTQHHQLRPLPPNATLWRYLNFTKFVSLLDRQALFFSSVDRLGDPFEGSYPKANVDMREEFMAQKTPEERQRISREVSAFTKGSRRHIVVNCWHRSGHESEAMWRLYSTESDGIAIKTDFSSFTQSFTGDKNVFVGEVIYIDYDTEAIDEQGNEFARYLTKRKSFEHEAEVRAISLNVPMRNGDIDRSPGAAGAGIYHDVDAGQLIKEVVVAPLAEDWFVELVQAVADQHGLSVPIRRSSLADSPRWGW